MNQKLELVSNRLRTLHGVQTTLFPFEAQRVALFAPFPEIGAEAFLDILWQARPSYCIEMRAIPSFDLELLNRRKVFAAFGAVECKYLDFVDSSLPPVGSSEFWARLGVSRKNLQNASGPTLFLVDQSYTPIVRERIWNELSEQGEHWEFYEATLEQRFLQIAR